jgi:phage host-nuclease inhibitor protein Gam
MCVLVNAMREETAIDSARIHEEIEGLRHMTVGQLKEKHREAFGEETRSNHKQFLFGRIAWRIQADAWGALSGRAHRRGVAATYIRSQGERGLERADRLS